MKAHFPLWIATAFLGCSAPPAALEHPVDIGLPKTTAQAATQSPAPDANEADATLFSNAALVGSISQSLVQRLMSRAQSSEGGRRLLAELNATRVVRALHFDPARPMTFAISSVATEDLRRDSSLVVLAPHPAFPSAAITDSLMRTFTGRDRGIRIRILIPSVDVGAALADLPDALSTAGAAVSSSPHRLRIALGRGTVGFVTRSSGGLVVDIVWQVSGHASAEWEGESRFPSTSAPDVAPALDGQGARVRWSPQKLGYLGWAQGLAAMKEALESETLDPAERDRTVSQGVWEASRNIALVGNEKGPFFESEELSVNVEGTMFRLNFTPGSGSLPIADASWADTQGVTCPSSIALLDVSDAFRKAVSRPSSDMAELTAMARAGGAMGEFLSFPYTALDLPRANGGSPTPLSESDDFERVTALGMVGSSDAFVGLMPAKSTIAAARCSLAKTKPCEKKDQLALGKIRTADGWSEKLVQVEDRFAVIVSNSAQGVEAPHLALVRSPVVRFLLQDTWLSDVFGTPHLGGEVTHDGSTIVLSAHSP